MSNLELWRSHRAFPFLTLDRLMEDVAGSLQRNSVAFSPRVEVKETAESYELSFDLPGVPKNQLKIDLQDDQLTVSGERSEEKETPAKDASVHLSELSYGTFSRSFQFPTAVDADKTEARYENGVLSIRVAKAATAKPRQIEIR